MIVNHIILCILERRSIQRKICGLTLDDVYDIETEILFHHGDIKNAEYLFFILILVERCQRKWQGQKALLSWSYMAHHS